MTIRFGIELFKKNHDEYVLCPAQSAPFFRFRFCSILRHYDTVIEEYEYSHPHLFPIKRGHLPADAFAHNLS